jgi:serine/threonine protein phosphatase PrpC
VTKRNQDRTAVGLLDGGVLLLSVFDGHGRGGEHVSSFAAKGVPTHLDEALRDADKDRLEALREALMAVDKQLLPSNRKVPCMRCGSTACVALVSASAQRCWVGWVGDSRCVLGSAPADADSDAWTAKDLSNDHKPDRADERARIECCQGARVTASTDKSGARVWFRVEGGESGLAVSRAIGDKAMRGAGVIAKAELCKHSLEARDRCLILASDGLFDVVPSAEAVRMAQAAMPDATRACQQLTSLAARRWRKAFGNSRDDISVVVLYLGDALSGVPEALQASTAPPPPAPPAGSDDEDDDFEEEEEFDEEGWEDVLLADEAEAASSAAAPPSPPRAKPKLQKAPTVAMRAVDAPSEPESAGLPTANTTPSPRPTGSGKNNKKSAACVIL